MAWSRRSLIVDDNLDMLNLPSCMLLTTGFQVIKAEDGFYDGSGAPGPETLKEGTL